MARTLSDAMADDAATVFLNTDEFAETVLRLIGGSDSQRVAVSGIWTERPTSRWDGPGDSVKRVGVLVVSDLVDVELRDLWMINGETWGVRSLGKVVTSLRHLDLVRVERERTATTQPNLR